MNGKGIVGILAAVAIVLLLGTHADAQLAKKGTYKGTFAWNSTGNVFEMDDGRVIFVGEFTGAFTNAAGKGFMHGTSWACPGITDTLNDITQTANGYCIVTDTDGDKAYMTWSGKKETEKAVGAGTFQWTGGTGKYTGIKGSNTYDSVTILPTPQGYSVCEGAWELP